MPNNPAQSVSLIGLAAQGLSLNAQAAAAANSEANPYEGNFNAELHGSPYAPLGAEMKAFTPEAHTMNAPKGPQGGM